MHLDLVLVSSEAARAEGGVWATLAEIALHHRVHMVPPFEHWMARGRNQLQRHGVQAEHPRVALEVRRLQHPLFRLWFCLALTR